PSIVVEDGKPTENDYSLWGISDEGKVIEVLEEDITYFDSPYVSTIKYSIGNKTKDGTYCYSKPIVIGTGITQLNDPVILLGADWVDDVFSGFHTRLASQ
ncbi:MAG: hypothetical protein MK035_07060, partial [Dehalococcoidia bacterium]|nr:hypothetical protein [Dehalococcoidia bacterium]